MSHNGTEGSEPLITIFDGRRRELGAGEKREIYAQVYVAMRNHLHLFKPSEWMVFTAISLHTDAKGWAFPTISTLASETGLNRGTIYRALQGLEELAIGGKRVLLRFQPRAGEEPLKQTRRKSGTFNANHYLIFPSPEEIARYDSAGVRHLGADAWQEKTVPVPPGPCTKNPPTEKPQAEHPSMGDADAKYHHPKEQPSRVGDVGWENDERVAMMRSLAQGVGAPLDVTLAGRTVKPYTVDQVGNLVAYARMSKGITDPLGFVFGRLRTGEIPAIGWCGECDGVNDEHHRGCSRWVDAYQSDDDEISAAPQEIAEGAVSEARETGEPDRAAQLDEIWGATLGELQLQMTSDTFSTWLKPTQLVDYKDDTLIVGVENSYVQDWLSNRLRSAIQRAASGVVGHTVAVEFAVRSAPSAAARSG